MRRGIMKRGKAVTENKRKISSIDPRMAPDLAANQLRDHAYRNRDSILMHDAADTIEALQQRVGDAEQERNQLGQLVVELLEVWDPEWEPGKSLHQRAVELVQGQALHQEPGEDGGGEKKVYEPGYCMACDQLIPINGNCGLKGCPQPWLNRPRAAQPEQAQEGECPHGCFGGVMLTHDAPEPRLRKYGYCPIHGTGSRKGDNQ